MPRITAMRSSGAQQAATELSPTLASISRGRRRAGDHRPTTGSTPALRLHDRTFRDSLAVVTGAGSGIGRATCFELMTHQTRLALIDRDLAAASTVAAEINALGGSAKAFRGDVADAAKMSHLADQIVESFGPVDILINNAGVGMAGRFADMSPADWDWIRSVNLDGVINGCRAFGIPMLKAGSGQIVNLSSGLGYAVRATEPAYVTTKAAVLAFSRCLRADWGQSGVGVSVVCPGVINTPILSSTRMLGDQGSERARRRSAALFSKGHSPVKVADAIRRAIETDRELVRVGWEAQLGWIAHRLLPTRAETRMGRIDIL